MDVPMTTMKDIAELSQVSPATVSRILNGNANVSLEKRQRVLEWVEKLNYRPNAAAQNLTGARSYLIGVLLPDISNPFFAEILCQIEEESSQQGYSLIINNAKGNRKKIREALQTYRSRRVDGIIMSLTPKESTVLSSLDLQDIPMVSVTQPGAKMDAILLSMEEGGALIARHFMDLGHERIGYIGQTDDPKFIGFKNELAKHGITISDNHIITLSQLEQYASRIIEKELGGLVGTDDAVSAIFAFNDIAAISTLHLLQARKLRIPQDVVVAGFDNIFLSRETYPTLTSVAQPTREIGRMAVELLVSRINSPEKSKKTQEIVLQPRIVVRESTRITVVD